MGSPLVSMQHALMSVGASLYSDDFACELLAWFHLVGGHNAAAVENAALSGALLACAAKLKIEGGQVPDSELCKVFKARVEELQQIIANDQPWPAWVISICERYDLKLPRAGTDYIKADFLTATA